MYVAHADVKREPEHLHQAILSQLPQGSLNYDIQNISETALGSRVFRLTTLHLCPLTLCLLRIDVRPERQ